MIGPLINHQIKLLWYSHALMLILVYFCTLIIISIECISNKWIAQSLCHETTLISDFSLNFTCWFSGHHRLVKINLWRELTTEFPFNHEANLNQATISWFDTNKLSYTVLTLGGGIQEDARHNLVMFFLSRSQTDHANKMLWWYVWTNLEKVCPSSIQEHGTIIIIVIIKNKPCKLRKCSFTQTRMFFEFDHTYQPILVWYFKKCLWLSGHRDNYWESASWSSWFDFCKHLGITGDISDKWFIQQRWQIKLLT